ncbi:hypothetical protein M23134_07779 [Microscilla marina ATCC 23134]|uniref:Uncharacterized protein n=1 Tax=Microscilla marina ATCC 23134 TaxID=313606 RepID=A1ZLC7_MICM2|nr:hypothetical protein M23134_07779 [Microscilla marina ATCC 23134]
MFLGNAIQDPNHLLQLVQCQTLAKNTQKPFTFISAQL